MTYYNIAYYIIYIQYMISCYIALRYGGDPLLVEAEAVREREDAQPRAVLALLEL